MRRFRRPVTIGLLCVLACVPLAATAATIHVPADHATIQAAIEAAVSGDVVLVASGRYRETLDFKGKAITVASTAPTSAAVVAPGAGGAAQILVTVTTACAVQVRVQNLAGATIALLPERALPQGQTILCWSGRAASGTKAPPGRYLLPVCARSSAGEQGRALVALVLGR